MGSPTGVAAFTHCSKCGAPYEKGYHLYTQELRNGLSYWMHICVECYWKGKGK